MGSKKKKRSSQQIVKYLGNVKNFHISDLPEEHRDNSRVPSLLALSSTMQKEKSQHMNKLKNQIFEYLKKGDVKSILEIADNFRKLSGLSEFYDYILKPILYEIGSLWATNQLDISTEHLYSNTVNEVITHFINESHKRKSHNKNKVLICTPEGEIHGLPCKVLESVLLEEGLDVVNLSPSIPATSLLKFISEAHPCALLISVTFSENLGSALHLIRKVCDHHKIPMLLGWFAVNNMKTQEITHITIGNPFLHIIKESHLETIVKKIQCLISDTRRENNLCS